MKRRAFVMGLPFAATALPGCMNLYPYTVLAQAKKNPMAATSTFGLAPLDLSKLEVDSGTPAAYRPGGEHAEVVARFEELFRKRLSVVLRDLKYKTVEGAPSAQVPLWIRPSLLYFNQGFTLGSVWKEAVEVNLRVDFLTPEQEVLDAILIEHWRMPGKGAAGTEDVRKDAQELANNVGTYIAMRRIE